MDLQRLFLIGLGGFVGTILRALLGHFVRAQAPMSFPIGTLLINVLGCFLIGNVWARYASETEMLIPSVMMMGVLGGFTTFSAFGLETFHLLEGREFGFAALYVFLSVGLGLGAVYLGVGSKMAVLFR